MKKHDCAWCRFENWLFQDFSHVVLMIALTVCGIFMLSALLMLMIIFLANLSA